MLYREVCVVQLSPKMENTSFHLQPVKDTLLCGKLMEPRSSSQLAVSSPQSSTHPSSWILGVKKLMKRGYTFQPFQNQAGVCYFWYGSNVEELGNAKPTKVSLATEDSLIKQQHKGSLPVIFAAKLQGVLKPGSANAFIASGLLVKPSFQKMVLRFGDDLMLNASKSGILLPITQSVSKSKKGSRRAK